MHHVGHIDWSFADHPAPDSAISSGVARLRIVGPEQGSVHTDLAVAEIKPGGWLVVEDFETLPAIPGSEEQADCVSRTTAAMRRVAPAPTCDCAAAMQRVV